MQTDLQTPMRPRSPLPTSLFGASAYLMGPPPPPRTGRADFACIKLRASALPPWRRAMADKALAWLSSRVYCSLRSCCCRSTNATEWSALAALVGIEDTGKHCEAASQEPHASDRVFDPRQVGCLPNSGPCHTDCALCQAACATFKALSAVHRQGVPVRLRLPASTS
jgi:hypothetical protein